MTEMFPNGENFKPTDLRTYSTNPKQNKHEATKLQHILITLLKTSDKEKFLKAVRKQNQKHTNIQGNQVKNGSKFLIRMLQCRIEN